MMLQTNSKERVMKKVLGTLGFLYLAFSVVPPGSANASEHGLSTVDRAWTKAMLANDAHACAALYDEEAVLVLPGTGAIKGRKAIEEAYTGWLGQVRVTAAAITDAQYRSAGDVSSGWGSWTVTTVPRAGGTPVTEAGTWCAVAVKRNGVWKYAADHASADPAPAATAK
jgi:uncharacterized protein (TIGR02246 family)